MESLSTVSDPMFEGDRSPTLEPDWSMLEPPYPSLLEVPESASILSARIDYGTRSDGSRQIGMLYGSIDHSHKTSSIIYERMLRDWEQVPQWYEDTRQDIGEKAVLIIEGRVRLPDLSIDRSKDAAFDAPHIIETDGELALFEYLARHAGVREVISAEPEDGLEGDDRDGLLHLAQVHGFDAMMSYLTERLVLQATEMGPEAREAITGYRSVTAYLEMRMWRYEKLREAAAGSGVETGIVGFKRSLDRLHPELASKSLEELASDPAFVKLTHDETRHVPILRKPAENRNVVERIAVDVNKERDRRLIRAVFREVARGKDVYVGASAIHLLPILSAIRQSGNAMIDSFGSLVA